MEESRGRFAGRPWISSMSTSGWLRKNSFSTTGFRPADDAGPFTQQFAD